MASLLYRGLGTVLSPAGPRARLTILIYHRVLPEPDPLFPLERTAEGFDRDLGWIKAVFNVLPLSEAVARLRRGDLPARAACITFDDGYADNLTHALPVLRKHGLSACFFIAGAYLDGGRMFNDTVIEAIRRARSEHIDLTRYGWGAHDVSTPAAKARAIGHILPKIKYLPVGEREARAAELAAAVTDQPLPDDLMLTTAQLRALRGAGMDIGGHTYRHPILARLDDGAAAAEILQGADHLRQILGEPVRLFSFPNGKPGIDYLPAQAGLVKSLGFEAAVSTHWGAASSATDLFQLPRFTPWVERRAKYQGMLIYNLAKTYLAKPPCP